eukprot:148374-Chlamydomonas_euryale.AAC.4
MHGRGTGHAHGGGGAHGGGCAQGRGGAHGRGNAYTRGRDAGGDATPNGIPREPIQYAVGAAAGAASRRRWAEEEHGEELLAKV